MAETKHPIITCILLILLVATVVAASFLVWFLRNENHREQSAVTANDYSRVLQQNITGSPRVVDIAMLCAHDAFSNEITSKSALDPSNDNKILENPVVRALGGGIFARQSKTQKSNAYDLARHGVRYFDVRVCWDGTQWQNMHSFISAPFEKNLRHLLRFLQENPGELLVADIQHHNTGGRTSRDLLDFIGTIKENGMSLWDYVRFDPYTVPLGALNWQKATQGGAGVVVLIKTPQTPGCKYYEYTDRTVRAVWHHKPDIDSVILGIEDEYAYLTQNFARYKDAFRNNQAQTTPPLDLGAIPYWSLLREAETSNNVVLAHPDFDKWLQVMPVVWLNNSDTMTDGFNDRIMERLNAFNRRLQ
ncbi:MAG: hypothetical protein LBJ12_07850 [Oscillospiraceae bacterium]|jgi:hypothetical protein|nr:hypothetical protein [Oscillospiraceae bacterium]